MVHESKDDALLEKVILFLVIVVGAVLVFNQFQYAKLSSNIFLNSISFLLILVLIGLVVWLFLKKEMVHEAPAGHIANFKSHVKIEKMPLTFHEKLSYGFVAVISVLILFNKRKKEVQVTMFTKEISKQLLLDLAKFNLQYPLIDVKEFTQSHDRFLIIDNKEVYHFGASLKDLGKKWFAFSRFDKDALKLLERL